MVSHLAGLARGVPGSAPISRPCLVPAEGCWLLAVPLAPALRPCSFLPNLSGCFPAPLVSWGTKSFSSWGPGCLSVSASLQELLLDSAHSQPLTSTHLSAGSMAGFNPFMAKLLTILYCVSTLKNQHPHWLFFLLNP